MKHTFTIKKVSKGQYGSYIVTRSNDYGVFDETGKLYTSCKTRAQAVCRIEGLERYFNMKEVQA